jgi:hypothetical protein
MEGYRGVCIANRMEDYIDSNMESYTRVHVASLMKCCGRVYTPSLTDVYGGACIASPIEFYKGVFCISSLMEGYTGVYMPRHMEGFKGLYVSRLI